MSDAPAPPSLHPKAATLGYAGLLPFVAGALGTLLLQDLDEAEWAARLVLYYGAVILSFLGGVHWGFALTRAHERAAQLLTIGVLPSLVGWGSLVLPYEQALAVQVAGFVAFWLYEHRVLGEAVLPRAYLDLRRRLTLIVCASLAIALIGSTGLS